MKRLITYLLCLAMPSLVDAANPAQVNAGLQLFTQEFAMTAPGLSGDGLGPVFNEASCVACHNAGGVGGSGDVRSNARSVGMQEFSYKELDPIMASVQQRQWNMRRRTGESTDEMNPSDRRVNEAVRKFSPAFISPGGSIVSSFPIHRRGGSPEFVALRNQSLRPFNPHWNDDNHASCDTVHQERIPQEITNDNQSLSMKVHVFARNTTPLFGTGLIDQIPDSVLWQLTKSQQSDNEVSGRPGTLKDGTLGKFGWRANFATLREFNENACSAELGLQSKRVPQPIDLANRNYVNPNPDISDDAILAMTTFVASLPRPIRDIPTDSRARELVALGEQRFAAVGCAKCHVPSIANIKDLYSDLLLHDMGPYAIDMAGAPPYIKSVSVQQVTRSETTVSDITTSYYGAVQTMRTASGPALEQGRDTFTSVSGNFKKFVSPQYPEARKVTPVSSPLTNTTIKIQNDPQLPEVSRSTIAPTRQIQTVETHWSQWVREELYEPTLVNQEWKTPPLWGLRDSAPYMHDGRAETILEAIAMHDGEGRGTRNRFFALSYDDQQAILAFLDTFVAPTEGVIEAPKKFTRRDLVAR
jgi:CxxC motif-containing protein (DUF1111 family)